MEKKKKKKYLIKQFIAWISYILYLSFYFTLSVGDGQFHMSLWIKIRKVYSSYPRSIYLRYIHSDLEKLLILPIVSLTSSKLSFIDRVSFFSRKYKT